MNNNNDTAHVQQVKKIVRPLNDFDNILICIMKVAFFSPFFFLMDNFNWVQNKSFF